MLWRALRWLLFRFDPEVVHHLAVMALRLLGWRPVARRVRPRAPASLCVEAMGLRFEHPLGLAAGFDKGEAAAAGVLALGFSHVEMGTITPRPQAGNPRPRLFRLPEHRALINRMGFNNDGAEICAQRLSRLDPDDRPGPIGVNVGKNKDTPNEDAQADYLTCIDRLHEHADYLVVNVSSPNTPGLRELQERGALERLLVACVQKVDALPVKKPLLLKLAPDLGDEALDDAVDVALAAGVSGFIVSNTTVQRPGSVATHGRARENGGLSGAPLEPLSTRALARVFTRVAGRVPIVGVGGVMSGADAYKKIRSGATLVQVYTGFIYGGPLFAARAVRELAELLRRDGFSRLSDAIGADVAQGGARP